MGINENIYITQSKETLYGVTQTLKMGYEKFNDHI